MKENCNDELKSHRNEAQFHLSFGKAKQWMSLMSATCISPSSPCLGLTEVPTGIPEDVVHIDLSHNSIRHLRAKDFHGARSLRTLNFSNNNMEHMDTGMCAIIFTAVLISEHYSDVLSMSTNVRAGNLHKHSRG